MSGGFVKISGIENVKSIKNRFVLTNNGELYSLGNKMSGIKATEKPVNNFAFSDRGLVVKYEDSEVELIEKNFDPNAEPYNAIVNNFQVDQYFDVNGGYTEIRFDNPMSDDRWYYTEIIRKQGTYPQNREDGVKVYKSYRVGTNFIKDYDRLFFDIQNTKYFYSAFLVTNKFVESILVEDNKATQTYNEIQVATNNNMSFNNIKFNTISEV